VDRAMQLEVFLPWMSDSSPCLSFLHVQSRLGRELTIQGIVNMVAAGEKKGKVILAYSGGLGELDSLSLYMHHHIDYRRHLLHSPMAH
jgi:hypothetical protein